MMDLTKVEHQLSTRGSLADRVKAKHSVSYVAVDCSASMGASTDTGQRRIDAMRDVVVQVRNKMPVKLIAFGHSYDAEFVDSIPEPAGSTPMHDAIRFAREQRATHLVLVSDGLPNSEEMALDEATRFGGKIDTIYVGPTGGYDGPHGSDFMKRIAAVTDGSSDIDSLSDPKQLGSKLSGLLEAGRPQLERV